jgi:tetratricopeptide (TPR) repeat protein
LEADFNQPTRRHTLQQTYDRIIADLKEAIELLPDRPLVVLRSSKPAAQALLARVYMSMRDYENCLKYANDCLAIKDDLIDYNGGEGIAQGGTYAFTRFHPEVIFESLALPASSFYYATVDSVLYDSYNDDDLRKTMFFAGRSPIVPFKGNYASTAGSHFSGHATDEVFLMRAECLARKGQTAAALTDLNHLLVRRWKTGTFVPFTAATAEEALDLILLERRKELVFRGVRWMDLKRLNKEGRNIELVRNLDGQIYRLAPNDLRYAMAIPKDIIQMTGIAQNPR